MSKPSSRFSAMISQWLLRIKGGSQELTSAGYDPFSDLYQSRNDRPAALKKAKNACTSAICVSSL